MWGKIRYSLCALYLEIPLNKFPGLQTGPVEVGWGNLCSKVKLAPAVNLESGIPPKEITMNTYIPTHWHSKALSRPSGAKIQFLAVCQLLSLLAKENLLALSPCWVPRECVHACPVRMRVRMVSCFRCVFMFILACSKPPHISLELWLQNIQCVKVAELSKTTVRR